MKESSNKLSIFVIVVLIAFSIIVASVILMSNTSLDYQGSASDIKSNPIINRLVDSVKEKTIIKPNQADIFSCKDDYDCEYMKECVNNRCIPILY